MVQMERSLGKEKLQYPGLPPLEDVMLVEGLIANLIYISQLCDEGLNVSFLKDQCLVTDNEKSIINVRYTIF